jgi:hypothetical protein
LEDLLDGDLAIAVGISRRAFAYVENAESDVDHGEDLIDGHRTVAVAVADREIGL